MEADTNKMRKKTKNNKTGGREMTSCVEEGVGEGEVEGRGARGDTVTGEARKTGRAQAV